ncbi:MAG: glycosyltransferase [Flavobacteriales bacterium]|nr:glycosyltransferase [Flavobacteriales bacterium]
MNKRQKHIHVIAFDVPYPANYGGVIDIFYKLSALHENGIKVHLHCYQYGRPESAMLKSICYKVHYYQRKIFRNPIYNSKPYIVASRNTKALIENLLKDQYPILFEGLHSTYYLDDERLKNRYKIVRTHNVEHDYYKHLENVETNLFKKYFFKVESDRLRKYEKILKYADAIAAISPNDANYFDKKYGNTFQLPPFHVNQSVSIKQGRGNFILYHGNLSVGENNEAALFLLKNVLNDGKYPVIIAGNDPSKELEELVKSTSNVTLKSKITSEEINHLIADAQINVLFTNQATGIKLKLLNSLFMGRHCIANSKMIENTELEELCIEANKPNEFRKNIDYYWNIEISETEIEQRSKVLNIRFNNLANIDKLIHRVFAPNENMVDEMNQK